MVRISVGTTRVIQLTIKIHFPKIDLVSCYAHLIVLAFAILSLALALRLQGRLQIFSSLVAILFNQQKLLLLFSKRTFFFNWISLQNCHNVQMMKGDPCSLQRLLEVNSTMRSPISPKHSRTYLPEREHSN